MYKELKKLGLLAIAALAMTGCDKVSESENVEYVAVQMSKGDNWSIVDKTGKEIVREEYPPESEFSHISVNDGVYWVKQDGKWQLFSISQPKNPLIDEEFRWATDFNCGVAAVSNPNQPIRIIDTKGKVVARLTKEVAACSGFADGGHAVFQTQAGTYGILGKNGKVVLPSEYGYIYHLLKDYLIVRRAGEENRLLILDFKGKRLGEIDEKKYNLISADDEGRILVREDNNAEGPVIVLDKTGRKKFDIRKSEWHYGEYYWDGYLVFANSDHKYGVADDKGETVIRPKYSSMHHLGQGYFAAMKNDKWGIVDAKDETVVDFEYTGAAPYCVGDLFLMLDGSSWSLIGSDGKEVNGFDQCVLYSQADAFAQYIDVDRLADGVVKAIEDLEQPLTAAQLAKKHDLSVNDYHYRSSAVLSVTVNSDQLSGNCTRRYDRSLAEERTHTEKVDDGWFTTTRTVSDGWHWSAAVPQYTTASLTLENAPGVEMALLRKAVEEKLKHNHKYEDGNYSRNVNFGKQGMMVQTSLEWNTDYISINISYFIKGKAVASHPVVEESESDSAVAVW